MLNNEILQKFKLFKNSLLIKENSFLIFFFLLFLFTYIGTTFLGSKDKNVQTDSNRNASIDTYIPKNHVLVPIDFVNKETLIQMTEQFALIDIYALKNNSKTKILSFAKMIKSPVDANSLAILLPEKMMTQFMNFEGPFEAVLSNKNEKNVTTEIITTKENQNKKLKKPITYQGA